MLGGMKSKAAATLRGFCRPKRGARPKMRVCDLARDVGVAPQQIQGWMADAYRPKLEAMLELKKLLGIPLEDWTREAR